MDAYSSMVGCSRFLAYVCERVCMYVSVACVCVCLYLNMHLSNSPHPSLPFLPLPPPPSQTVYLNPIHLSNFPPPSLQIVYPVDGGMEDWAYAASWDNEFTDPAPVTPCNPPTYGGMYPCR